MFYSSFKHYNTRLFQIWLQITQHEIHSWNMFIKYSKNVHYLLHQLDNGKLYYRDKITWNSAILPYTNQMNEFKVF